MEDSRATVLNTGLAAVFDWIKSNRLVVLTGALTTIFGLIGSAGNVAPLMLKGLNLPDCLTYAGTYRKPESYFKNDGSVWREYFHRTAAHTGSSSRKSGARETISICLI